jgi:hypothetical protein
MVEVRSEVLLPGEFLALMRRVAVDGERITYRFGDFEVGIVPIEDLPVLEEWEDSQLLRLSREAEEESAASGEPAIALEQVKDELGL